MGKKKEKKERKRLTLHKHYIIDIRRFKDYLEIEEEDWGRELEIRETKITFKGEKIKAINIAII